MIEMTKERPEVAKSTLHSQGKRWFAVSAAIALFCTPVLFAQQFERGQEPPPISPAASALAFIVPDDLEVELVLCEPLIAQPLQLTFDERGRLWVLEYRQYPAPAGLRQVSHDKFWRSVYDQVPPPPPNHFVGKDRISIHEDSNGDGIFDRSKVFVDGLNIATSIAIGRGGVWVLNPPYLLFYADQDRDDVPDGDPEVHLSGFGLEDTHSVANSLRWGPDGWLYGCQGSTVSGNIVVENAAPGAPPAASAPVRTLGQNVWRYHPETRRYEVFSEGGGNAFGLEVDAAGRVFSGHNGGDTRGFHYVQGAYLQKGFQKHGELSNPHAFGYFPAMDGNRAERFTHTFIIYQEEALPGRYHGSLFGVEPMQGRVILSEITADASSFATRDLEHVLTTSDRWFRPVDIKPGPDGAVYVADWHDFSINHWKNYLGNMDAAVGRVWRVKAKQAKPVERFDLAAQSDEELLARLADPRRWLREAASRVLIDRQNPELLAALATQVRQSSGPAALAALWTWQAMGARTASSASAAPFLAHADPQVRLWATRFIGDPFPGALDSGAQIPGSAGPEDLGERARRDAPKLLALAASEPSIEVRVQLAATAKRLPVEQALPLIKALAQRDEDAADKRQPLMIWWALEAQATADREAVVRLFADPAVWDRPLVKKHLLERLMRRLALDGPGGDLPACATLLDLSPAQEHSEILMRGFEEAFKGRSFAGLPEELMTAMARHGVGSVAVGLRRGDPQALEEALQLIASGEVPMAKRRQLIQVLGEVRAAGALPLLMKLLRTEQDDGLLQATLAALQPFTGPEIAGAAMERLPQLAPGARAAAFSLLTSRESYGRAFLQAVESREIPADLVPAEFVRALKGVTGDAALASIDRLWPHAGRPSSAEMQRETGRLLQALEEGHGDPYKGKQLYTTACAACHQLFDHGGAIGPELTSFDRRDVRSLLLSIVNPSAEIREGYENFSIVTKEGRSLGGFIVEQNERRVILRGYDGQDAVLAREDIAVLDAADISLMPEGLTHGLDDQQVRDLFAYLRSAQPLND